MIDFPNTPTNGQLFTAPNGITYRWSMPPGVWNDTGQPSGPISPLTMRGDLYYYGFAGNTRLPLGVAATLLSSNGTDAVWIARSNVTTAPNIQVGVTYTIIDSDNYIIANGSATLTLTLPNPSLYAGRCIRIQTYVAFAVVSSASPQVIPIVGGTATTAILPATAGKWADIVSDGTSWRIVGAN